MGLQMSVSRKNGRKKHELFRSNFFTNKRSTLSHTFSLADDEKIVDLININTSEENDFLKVPEISIDLARNIIKHRKAIGYYKKVDDLVVVPGMGAERLNRIRHYFSINNKSVLINVNRSSIFELQMVHGITQEMAAAIIVYRNKKGQFKRLDDLRKIKCIDYIRLDNIRRYLTLQDNEDNAISKTESKCHSDQIISNGFSPLHATSMKYSAANGITNGIASTVLADIFELLSIYSSRPIINEIFGYSRNGKPAFRVSSWNLQNFSLEKASNMGVKEVVCRTVLENGWSILAIQNVESGVALKLICDELNNPKLQRIGEWKGNSRHWKYDMLESENGNLGFIYDGRGNGTKLLSSEKGPPELDHYCESMVTSFEISNCEVQILNLKVKVETEFIEVQDCIQKLLNSETNYLICGDFGSHMRHIDILGNLENSQLVLLKNTRNHLHSRTNFPKYCTSNFVLNVCMVKHFTGFYGVIRHGLTHLAIPSGWSWGGSVSSYCPIWVEFFVNPEFNL